jgi:hypothetical protein
VSLPDDDRLRTQLKRVSYVEAAGILGTRDPVLSRLIDAAGTESAVTR